MKRSYIFALIVIAVAVGIIISTASDASTYMTFSEARELASKGSSKQIHVVGELKKDATGNIIGIEPTPDKLAFRFVLIDEDGREQQVYYNEPMPADFTKSDKVVIIGSYYQDIFRAEKILLKCPSKYEDTNFQSTALTN